MAESRRSRDVLDAGARLGRVGPLPGADVPRRWRSLAEMLAGRAQLAPERLAFRFVSGLLADEGTLSYGDLDRSARATATLLVDAGLRGRPVVLLVPPGLSFVASLFGCFYAGAVAVPTYPPHPARMGSSLERLQTLTADAAAAGVLTTTRILEAARGALSAMPALERLRWLAVDDEPPEEDASLEIPTDREALALLQYTSGSTRSPRGVMLSHENLLENSAFIFDAFGHSTESRGVIWLPPYHDMGLMGGIVQPVFGGFPCTLMPPLDFFRRPVVWLRAVTRFRATTSGGPNFAYERCLTRIGRDQREGLDLSSWEIAFNGAEPVQAKTLRNFATEFAPHGFRARAWLPCYGLAEASLAVTCGDRREHPTVEVFERTALEENRARATPAGAPGSVCLVGCGRPARPGQVAIADAATGSLLPEGEIGEIHVRSGSVARGYWGREEETSRTFHARIGDGVATYLRTGDLGFLHREELFVTGRIKEVLVLRGRKYYPQDIEALARGAHPAVDGAAGAAFTISGVLSERVVVVLEIDPRRLPDSDAIVRSIRRAVASGLELQLHAVALVRPGEVPRTASGKVQRARCRSLFLERRLEALASWSLEDPG